MKWEYATLQLKNDHDLLSESASSHSETGLAARLSEMGRDGWELVAVWANVAFFKRPERSPEDEVTQRLREAYGR